MRLHLILFLSLIANLSFANCLPTTACTRFHGEQEITTTYNDSLQAYQLVDSCRGNGILAQTHGGWLFLNATNQWTDDCTDYQRNASTAFWAAQQTYDYFSTTFDRNSYDDNGGLLKVSLKDHCNTSAVYEDGTIILPQGCDNYDGYITALDIIAHEFTHGITESEGLSYSGVESKALIESFCDIFGIMVEFYVEEMLNISPDLQGDYSLGEDIYSEETFDIETGEIILSKGTRSLSNPPSRPVNTLEVGLDFYTESFTDKPHLGAGIQNKWFYLLAEGGIHNGVVIEGITKEKVALITYKNLTEQLSGSITFDDARVGALNAAEELYGTSSCEYLQTALAWDAVGVFGEPFDTDCMLEASPNGLNTIQIFPNPFGDFIAIKGNGLTPILSIQVLDSHGKLVIETTQKEQISTSHLPKGIYIYRFFFKNEIVTGKVLKL